MFCKKFIINQKRKKVRSDAIFSFYYQGRVVQSPIKLTKG